MIHIDDLNIQFIRKKIKKAKKHNCKLRPIGSNFGIELYDN